MISGIPSMSMNESDNGSSVQYACQHGDGEGETTGDGIVDGLNERLSLCFRLKRYSRVKRRFLPEAVLKEPAATSVSNAT